MDKDSLIKQVILRTEPSVFSDSSDFCIGLRFTDSVNSNSDLEFTSIVPVKPDAEHLSFLYQTVFENNGSVYPCRVAVFCLKSRDVLERYNKEFDRDSDNPLTVLFSRAIKAMDKAWDTLSASTEPRLYADEAYKKYEEHIAEEIAKGL